MKHWKDFKDGLFLVPAVMLAAGAFAGFRGSVPEFPEIPKIQAAQGNDDTKKKMEEIAAAAKAAKNAEQKTKKAAVKKVKYDGESIWKDGIYVGSGTGYGGSIQVQVVIKKGKIADIQILSHAQETPEYFAKAQRLTQKILKAQSPNVSAVSGATLSSRGIMEAVVRALIQAGDNTLTVQKNTEKTAKVTVIKKTTKKTVKGQPADGVFSGSAVCERFGYTVHLKTKFRDGKTVAVFGLKITGNSDPLNAAYWKKAWKPVVKGIIEKQSADVDAVSGATYSSNAVMEAYADAYEAAVAKNDNSAKKKTQTTKAPKATSQPKTTIADDTASQVPSGEMKDGTYHVSAVCSPDTYEDFTAYTLSADVVFENQVCTSISDFTSDAEENRSYYLRAAEGTKKAVGVVDQILKNQSADGIYAVTGATCSSKTIRSLYLQALAQATGAESNDSEEIAAAPLAQEPVSTLVPDADGTETAAPLPAAATDSSGTASGGWKDGIYSVTTTVYPDDDEDFYEYELRADAVVSEGKFTGFENISVNDVANLWYCNRALEGTADKTGILEQLIEKQNALGIDAVTGATCSSDAWMALFQEVMKQAAD